MGATDSIEGGRPARGLGRGTQEKPPVKDAGQIQGNGLARFPS